MSYPGQPRLNEANQIAIQGNPPEKTNIRTGSWNVGALLQERKLDNARREMNISTCTKYSYTPCNDPGETLPRQG